MILPDYKIRELSLKQHMIKPFDDTRVSKIIEKISWGVSSYGYDIRLSNEFYVPNIKKVKKDFIIDPKNFDLKNFNLITSKEGYIVIPKNSYVLAKSLEYFKIPRNILVIVYGKSTYARCGLIVNITPLEPEWEGHITISIINPLDYEVKVYTEEGIAQLIFLEASKLCKMSYKDKKGKYQAQKVITPPK